jgi:uncharacterized membrane protein YraQ (UPF0718 family)
MTVETLEFECLWQRALRIDRVAIAMVALLLAIAAVSARQLEQSLGFALEALLHIAPYLLASVGLAAYLKAAGAERLIARVFSGSPALMITSASLFGALSPFCSCGVIPLIAALLSMGVPLAPVMAFWVSSPLMAPDMFLVTAGTLGTGFAIAKTLAAVGIGLLAGAATLAAQRLGLFPAALREGVGDGGCAGSAARSSGEVVWRVWLEPERRFTFARSAWQNGLFLGKWLALAFLLESLMVTYLPAALIASWLGGGSVWAIPMAVAVGVPAYLNGYAALPIVAGLMDAGMTPGSAMAFLTAGGMTSIPAALAVFALVRRPVFVWYLGLALVASALSGVLYQIAVSV